MALSFVLKRESFLRSASTGGCFVEMTNRNSVEITMALERRSRAEFRLQFLVQFGFFMDQRFFLKVSFLKRGNRRLFLKMTAQNDDGSKPKARAEFCFGLLQTSAFFLDSIFALKRESISKRAIK